MQWRFLKQLEDLKYQISKKGGNKQTNALRRAEIPRRWYLGSGSGETRVHSFQMTHTWDVILISRNIDIKSAKSQRKYKSKSKSKILQIINIMPEHIDSQESISKMSTSQSSSVEDLNATLEQSHPSPLQRLKKQWKEIKKEWGPLMAAKEDLYDEYTFPPGRYSGQR